MVGTWTTSGAGATICSGFSTTIGAAGGGVTVSFFLKERSSSSLFLLASLQFRCFQIVAFSLLHNHTAVVHFVDLSQPPDIPFLSCPQAHRPAVLF